MAFLTSYDHHRALGKHPKKTDRRTLQFARYLPKLPTPPAQIDHASKLGASIGMMGNDQYGDCTVAAAGHMIQSWSAYGGDLKMDTPSDAAILAAYQAISPNDDGAFMLDVLNYWRKTGVGTDRIEAFIEVAAADLMQARLAIRYFGSVYIGMALPDTDTFGPWDVANPTWPPDPYNGHCFPGDTKVSLLDGRELTFAELAAGAAGPSFAVYSTDKKGNIVPGNAHSVRLTRKNAKLVKVTLDSGEEIRCTPDHLFRLRDGSYCKAKKLKPETSLMPLYRRVDAAGYEQVYNPRIKGKCGWHHTHRLVLFGPLGKTGGLVSHHRNHDKANNSPANLIAMLHGSHNELHTGGMNAYAISKRGREKSSELMKRLWADPVWRANRLKQNGENGKKVLKKLAEEDRCGFQVKETFQKSVETRTKMGLINHAVVSVEPCGRADVYDLTVDKHHNFALTAGVFVHNCVNLCAYDDAKQMFKVCTWGEVWDMSYSWYQRYADEAYAVLNDIELIQSSGLSPEGFNFAQLQDDLNHIGDPIVDPTPTPGPTPTNGPTGPLVITGVGGAYWTVWRDGLEEDTQHSQQFEAVQHADALRWQFPNSTIEIHHGAIYRVE